MSEAIVRKYILTATQQNQLAGLGLILGGVYGVIWGVAHVIPAALLGAGLLVLERRQRTGKLGRAGLSATLAALIAGAVFELVTLLAPQLPAAIGATPYLIVGLVLSAGMVLYGLASTRAGKFHGGELLVAGPLSIIVLGAWGGKLGALGFAVLGFFLLASKVAETSER